MSKPVSPARRAYLKRKAKVMRPFYLSGLGLLAVGLAGHMLFRRPVGVPLGDLISIGIEFAGPVLIFYGVWRGLQWEKTAPFARTDGGGAS